MNKLLIPALAIAAGLSAAPVMAQGAPAQVFVGGQVGVHDLGIDGAASDTGTIYGVFAGVDMPVSNRLFIGAEANYNYGSRAIDREYGIAARIGTEVSPGTKIFGRVGYQEVDFDLRRVVGGPVASGSDDTDGDYMVGVGADIAVAQQLGLRVAFDTISFDTTRFTAGVAMRF